MRRDTRTERAAKRRFAMLVLLHTHARQYDEIVASLDQDKLFDYDRCADPAAIARQQRFQFRHDLAALRLMGCEISFVHSSRCYVWRNSPFGLSLDQTQLSAFALLLDTFEHTTILHAADVEALLTYLAGRLPDEQRKVLLFGRRRSFSIDLHEATDYRSADPFTVGKIELSIQRGRQLEFLYRTPRDGKERRHVIEPRPMVFEHGHVYLYGWSINRDKELRFRLDYIVPGSAMVLPIQVRSSRPSQTSKLLRYHLSPVIARNRVSEHFPGQVVEAHADGSATVSAQVTDLFEARRTLLSYGLNCTVLEPPELVEEMRMIAAELYKMYCTRNE